MGRRNGNSGPFDPASVPLVRRRGHYVTPEIRVSRVLAPTERFSGSTDLSPDVVAQRRKPMLLRGWMQNSTKESSRRLEQDESGNSLGPLMALWGDEARLRSAFDGWALRKVRGQWETPVFKLSGEASTKPNTRNAPKQTQGTLREEAAATTTKLEVYHGLPMSEFLDVAQDEEAPFCYYTVPLEDWTAVGDGSLVRAAEFGWRDLAVHDPAVSRLTRRRSDSTTNASSSSSSSSTTTTTTTTHAGSSQAPPPQEHEQQEQQEHLPVAMVWASHPLVTAHTHFDKSNNFLVQVLGRKRVLLYSPDQSPNLYPHPENHPNYHQSQVDFSAPDAVAHPLFASWAAAEEAVLEPGDVLYIPPYWWHRIETLPPERATGHGASGGRDGSSGGSSGSGSGVGLSLSVVSPSAEEATLSQALWHPLPFLARSAAATHKAFLPQVLRGVLPASPLPAEEAGKVEERIRDPRVRFVAAQAYLAHLLSRLPPALSLRTPASFTAMLKATRYDPEELQLKQERRHLFEQYEEYGEEDEEEEEEEDGDFSFGEEAEEEEFEDVLDEDGVVVGRRPLSASALGGGRGGRVGGGGGGGQSLDSLLGEGQQQQQRRRGDEEDEEEDWVGRSHPLVKLHALGLCVAGSTGHAKNQNQDQQGGDEGFLELRNEHEAIVKALPKAAIASAAHDVARLLSQVATNDYTDDDDEEVGEEQGQRPRRGQKVATAAGAGIVELWLLDYVDGLARWALGLSGHRDDRPPAGDRGAEHAKKKETTARRRVGKGGRRRTRAQAKAEKVEARLERVEALGEWVEKCVGSLERLPEQALAAKTVWEAGPPVLKVEPDRDE